MKRQNPRMLHGLSRLFWLREAALTLTEPLQQSKEAEKRVKFCEALCEAKYHGSLPTSLIFLPRIEYVARFIAFAVKLSFFDPSWSNKMSDHFRLSQTRIARLDIFLKANVRSRVDDKRVLI